MNEFRFGQLLEETDLVCDYLDHFVHKGSISLAMPMRERYRYELLKFAVYLADADNMIDTAEVMYIRQILGVNSVVPAMLISFLMIVLVSLITPKPSEEIQEEYADIKHRMT